MASKVRAILGRVFKRGHPDIYDAAKAYADKKNLATTDVIGAAVSAYLAMDEEGQEVLEKHVAARRGGGGGGKTGLKPAIEMFKTMCGAMGDMFKTMNESRASLQSNALIADYKAVTEAASEIKKLGGEGGSGSMDDYVARLFLGKLFGDSKIPRRPDRKTGKDKIEEIDEE